MAATSRRRGSIDRSAGVTIRIDERRRDERLRDRHEPPRRPEVDRSGVEGDQEPEAEHHGRGAERQQDEAVEGARRPPASASAASPPTASAISAATPAKATE